MVGQLSSNMMNIYIEVNF